MFDRETENVIAIGEFLESNNLKKNDSMIAEFRAFVQYLPANISGLANVQIKKDTYNFGTIDIEESDNISLKKVHTNFLPQFCEYSYDNNNNSLIIKGVAHLSKGGKPYTITITPC